MDARRTDSFGTEPPTAASSAGPSGLRATTSGLGLRKILVLGLALVLLAGAADFGWRWWTVGRYEVSTDDAYLNADKVTVSPHIAGYMAEVRVGDNQKVSAGDVIALLDDSEFKIQLRSAEAEVAKAQADLLGASAALVGQQAQIASAKADVSNAEAAQNFSQQEFGRYQSLAQSGAGSSQRQQQADADLRQRRAALDKARAALIGAQTQVDSLNATQASDRALVDQARAKADQARLNLDYTKIVAPIDGVVGDRSLRVGQFVMAGTSLLTIVPMGAGIYLTANFKETQTISMRVGQPVVFTLDAFGGREFKGHVESLAPGTGAQFALLPPENATGNFTKIVQRVPVRIALDASDPLVAQIRPGLSADATVRVGPASEPTRVSEAQEP